MKYFKLLVLLLVMVVAQDAMAQRGPSGKGSKFEVVCYNEQSVAYTLYFRTIIDPQYNKDGDTLLHKGQCSLISPEEYEKPETLENAKPELFLRPKRAVKYTGQIKIPGSVENSAAAHSTQGDIDVVAIEGDAFDNSTVSSVDIPEQVNDIGIGVFSSCGTLMAITVDENNETYSSVNGSLYDEAGVTLVQVPGGLTSFELPAEVTDIDEYAFFDQKNLETVTVAEGNAFYEVDNGILYKKDGEGNKEDVVFVPSSTEVLDIPEGVTSLGNNLIWNCRENITTINIPASVTSITVEFFSCPKLNTITVNPSNVTYWGKNGGLVKFENWNGDNILMCCPPAKTSFEVPEGVETINYSAFYECNKLETLSFPKTLISIPEFILYTCSALETITVDADNTQYWSGNGGLVKNLGNTLVCCPPAKTSFDIPAGVAKVGEMAFYSCEKLTKVSLPASVQYMEGDFSECKALETITVDAGNTYFYAANGGLVKTEGKVLLCCPPAKTSFVVPNDVLKFDTYAFNNCVYLTTLTIPASLKYLDGGAFDGCTAMEAFYVDAGSENFSARDGVLYDKEEHTLYKCPAKKESLTLTTLPEVVGGAFGDFKGKLTINITDADKPFVAEEVGFSVPANTEVHYLRSLPAGKFGTITTFFTPDNFDDFYFYKLDDASETTLSFKRVTEYEFTTATPYLYRNANDGDIATGLHSTTDGYFDTYVLALEASNWKFYPTFKELVLTGEEYYVLSNNSFKCSSAKVTVNPFRAYLKKLGGSPAKENMEIIVDGEPTGITIADVDNDFAPNSNETRYNIAGQKVGNNYKGIVIVGGKKYIVK